MKSRSMRDKWLLSALCALASGMTTPAAADPGPEPEALARPALMASHPERAVLLGAALAGERLVAVGERGIVIVSDDRGATWRQVAAPVSVTLTGVRFDDARHGVIVGHGGVVLVTDDGGEHWALRLDGRKAARIVEDAARAGGDDKARADAERLVAEGPDKPFLDVLSADPQHIEVVGAYGLALASEDGGQHWSSRMDRLPNPRALHYYALRQRGAEVVLAGEQGTLLRSADGGKTFARIDTPYRGSFFTAELPADHDIVVAGLRGNLWRSADDGKTWRQIASPDGATFTASALLPDGGVLLGDQAGFVFRLAGDRLEPFNRTPLPPVNGLVAAGPDRVLALTPQGVAPVDSR